MNMRQFLSSAFVVLALVFAPPVFANSHFQYNLIARPAVVSVNGQARIHVIAGSTDSTQWLAWKNPSSEWTAASTTGPGNTLSYVSGAVGDTVDSSHATSWGAQAAVYVINSSGHLWQNSYAPSTGTASWRDVTGTGAPSLYSNPPLVAAWDARNQLMWVATTVYNSSNSHFELWSCRIGGASSSCLWENENTFSGAQPLLGGDAGLAIDTSCSADSYPSFYAVSSSGSLLRFRWWAAGWNSSSPGSPVQVDATGLQAWSSGTTCYAAGAGYNTSTGFESLLLASITGTSTFAWTDLTGGGSLGPSSGISYQLGNIAHSVSSGTHVLWTVAPTTALPYALWQCSLNLSGPSCTWTNRGHPADEIASVFGFGMLGYASTGYVVGYVGATAAYLYGYDSAQSQWQQHLTYRDAVATTLTNPGNVQEYAAAEYDGIVLITATEVTNNDTAFYRSTDDGSTFGAPTYPLGGPAGDVEVDFDAGGTAYAMCGNGGWLITSTNQSSSSPTWSTPYIPPPGIGDRESMVADWNVAGRIYVESGTYPSPTYFMYCASGASCASSSGVWCGPYSYPDSTNALIALAGDGNLYFASTSINPAANTACPPPSGYNASIGVRRITNVASLPGSCATPTWSAVECLYYAIPTSSSQTRNAGSLATIKVNMDAPRDGSTGPVITLVGYTDTYGNPCTSSSTRCRADIYATWRSTSGSWYATSQASMVRVNDDSFNCGTTSCWFDHILPSVIGFDYGLYNVAWMDWREDPTNDLLDHLYSATINSSSVSTTSTVWQNPSGYSRWRDRTSNGWPGDIQIGANVRLHGHQLGSLGATASDSSIVSTAIVSPFVH